MQLRHQMPAVSFYGCDANAELGRDLFTGRPLRDQRQDFPFTRAEPCRARRRETFAESWRCVHERCAGPGAEVVLTAHYAINCFGEVPPGVCLLGESFRTAAQCIHDPVICYI